ncbi:MAG: hypothetical protein ACRDHZ_22385 [Ktedonobacteraceae bacterium]
MTKATDFTSDEAELLFSLTFVVAGTSLAIVHGSALKVVKTAFSLYLIVRDTSRQFPDSELVQTIFAQKGGQHQQEHNERLEKHLGNNEDITITAKQGKDRESSIRVRNEMCEQAIGILNEKCPAEESEGYKRWLLLIASEVMHKTKSNGFLGFGKERAEAEINQALQDFALILQIPQ